MNYTRKIWEQDGKFGWSILDYVGDEVASSDDLFDNEQECRTEARCA